MSRLLSRLTKLEQQFKANTVSDIQQLSHEEILAEYKRIKARLAESNCPHCPDCTTPEHCLEIERIMARLNIE
jgi:DNA-binding GntR family transcriptional regulator